MSVTQGDRFPRWTASGAIYHIGFHLADSVPSAQLEIWREKRELLRTALADTNTSLIARNALRQELQAVFNDNIEKYLKAGYGECLLRNPEAQQAVVEILKHDNGKRYALHAYTVMPNHLHVVVGGFGDDGTMKVVIDGWKKISAHRINRACGRTGAVWQRDAYTHIIRNREEYARQLKYVWNTPEVAGLSSGYSRERFV